MSDMDDFRSPIDAVLATASKDDILALRKLATVDDLSFSKFRKSPALLIQNTQSALRQSSALRSDLERCYLDKAKPILARILLPLSKQLLAGEVIAVGIPSGSTEAVIVPRGLWQTCQLDVGNAAIYEKKSRIFKGVLIRAPLSSENATFGGRAGAQMKKLTTSELQEKYVEFVRQLKGLDELTLDEVAKKVQEWISNNFALNEPPKTKSIKNAIREHMPGYKGTKRA